MVLIFVFVIGAVIGSFMSCWLCRIHNEKSVLIGRSRCEGCDKILKWFELLPVISFVAQRGRCRSCNSNIHLQDPFIELVLGLLFVGAYIIANELGLPSVETVLMIITYWIAMSVLVAVFVYDARWQIIPDKIMIPGIMSVLVLEMIFIAISETSTISVLYNSLIAMAVGGGFFLVQFVISDGKWIGGGDIRLGAFMGLVLGWPHIITALMIAYIVGAIVSVGIVLARRKKFSSHIAFGTFLSFAAVVTLFWGNDIVAWYIGLL